MNIFYEESGKFKVGVDAEKTGASYSAKTERGKKVKIKEASVFLSFDEDPETFWRKVEEEKSGFDVEFVWEAAQDETDFESLAREYYGSARPTQPQLAAILSCLYENPVYFHKKGRGRFAKAPEEILRQALRTIKLREEEQKRVDAMEARLREGVMPAEVEAALPMIMFAPDKRSGEFKAFSAAADAMKISKAELAKRFGFAKNEADLAQRKFLFEFFQSGAGAPDLADPVAPDLPLAEGLRVFSIDSDSTTEIDDCLSLRFLPSGEAQVGIHIAAPTLGALGEPKVWKCVEDRMSTVYLPGQKIPMLPANWVSSFSLDEGQVRPALSVYFDVAADGRWAMRKMALEKIRVEANLRTPALQEAYTREAIAQGGDKSCALNEEILWLCDWARKLKAGRGADPDEPIAQENDIELAEDGTVRLVRRWRNDPIETLVGETMILANGVWAKTINDAGVAGIFRSHTGGDSVRMSSVCAPHKILGKNEYGWFTSPLRRSVDFVNQTQLMALLSEQGVLPSGLGLSLRYVPNDPNLYVFIKKFETAKTAYGAIERTMDNYYSMVWLESNGVGEVDGVLVKDGFVKLVDLPLAGKADGVPFDMPLRTKLRLRVTSLDPDSMSFSMRYLNAAPSDSAAGQGAA